MTASVTTTSDLGFEVVIVRGEVDLKTAAQLGEALTAAIDATDGTVLVDLTEVTFLDSTALAVFVTARAHADTAGTTLELICPNPRIKRIFAMTALNRVFRIYDQAPEAGRARAVRSAPARTGMHAIRLTATDEAPGAARQFIGDKLTEGGRHSLDDDLTGDVLLLVSEIVTNAVRYGGSDLEVRLWLSADRVRVEVQDPVVGELPEVPQLVDVTAGRGRGLMIVDAVASDWGVTPAPGGAGKIVWFELAHPA